MKRFALLALGLAVALTLAAPAQGSSLLKVTGWELGDWSDPLNVRRWTGEYDGGTKVYATGSFHAGSVKGTLGGEAIEGPLYCVDLERSYYLGAQWQVDVLHIPDANVPPPPYNTDHIAWIYKNYGRTAANVTDARAAQLALWEVSHDQGWYSSGYNSSSWHSSGDFQHNSGGGEFVRSGATGILSELAGTLGTDGGLDASATYYRPSDWEHPSASAQGLVGNPIPEPGVLMLLGVGLGLAGFVVKRRRG